MPKNTTRKRSAQLKSVDDGPKRIAETATDWRELKTLIREHVERLAFKYDDWEQAESLVLLIDLLTNQEYERGDREGAAMIARDHALTFTKSFRELRDQTVSRWAA